MATGVTNNKWSNSILTIEPSEQFGESTEFTLSYEGKKAPDEIIHERAKVHFESAKEAGNAKKLFFGDNLEALKFLLQSEKLKGKVDLVYIDPPYGTNSIFQSRNLKDSYKDNLVGSHYIEFIRRRLILLKELLSETGSIYVHLDSNMTSQIKVIMDEVFGAKNFRGLITRKKCSNKNYTKSTYGNISDYILFYSKTDDFKWHRPQVAWTQEKILKEYPYIDEKSGNRYKKVPIHAPGIRNGETGKEWRGKLPPKGKHWQYTPKRLDEMDAKGEIYWSSNGNPRRKVFFDSDRGIPVQDIWLDLQDSLNQNISITGYPTEKTSLLLERIIKSASDEGDTVLDCFAGSGGTLDVADQLGRNWIGIDNSVVSIETILKRFTGGLEKMGDYVAKNDNDSAKKNGLPLQGQLFEQEASYSPDRKTIIDFSILSDSRYIDFIREILEEIEETEPNKM